MPLVSSALKFISSTLKSIYSTLKPISSATKTISVAPAPPGQCCFEDAPALEDGCSGVAFGRAIAFLRGLLMALRQHSAWWCGFALPRDASGGWQVSHTQQGPCSSAGPEDASALGAAAEMRLRGELIFLEGKSFSGGKIFITSRKSNIVQAKLFSNNIK